MKNKKTKLLMRILLLFTLCMVMLGTGCEKDKNKYDPDSIIDKWMLLYSTGGFNPVAYPEGTYTVEFTEDSLLIQRSNGVTEYEGKFDVSGDTLKYYRETNLEYRIELSNDTLALYFIIDGIDNFYKRIR